MESATVLQHRCNSGLWERELAYIAELRLAEERLQQKLHARYASALREKCDDVDDAETVYSQSSSEDAVQSLQSALRTNQTAQLATWRAMRYMFAAEAESLAKCITEDAACPAPCSAFLVQDDDSAVSKRPTRRQKRPREVND